MIWRRLKKYVSEQEEKPVEKEDLHVSFKEHLVMTLTAFVVIVIPCALVLIVLSLLTMWLFGLL